MKQYIKKSALVAEIEKIKSYIGSDKYLSDFEKGCNFGREDVCDSLLNFLDALEVKEVEEPSKDLEKEIQEVQRNYKTIEEYKGYPCTMYADDIEWIAKHFFELGLKARKGE